MATTQDPTVASFTPINMWAMLRALINNGCPVLSNAGAPTSGTSGTFAGQAGPGTLLIDYTNANLYMNIGTTSSPTWMAIGGAAVYGSITAISADGAITPTQTAQYAVNKGSAAALTIIAPTVNGVEIIVTSDSAFAHAITFTGSTLDSGSSSALTATFNPFKGSSLTIVSFNSRWKVVAANGVSFS